MSVETKTNRKVGSAELVVSDRDGVAAFYERVVGLTRDGEEFTDPSSGAPILTLIHDPAARRPATPVAGLFHLAFLYPDQASLAAAIRRSFDNGMRAHGFQDHGVSEAFYLSDPEGNGIELYVDRPESEWPRAGTELAMISDPIPLQQWMDSATKDVTDSSVRLGHVHLRAADLISSTQFYKNLGMDVTQSTYPGARFLAFDGYHHHVAVNTWSGEGLPTRQPNETGLVGFTFEGSEADAVDPNGIRISQR